MTHYEVENTDTIKEMLEEWAKKCAHLRFYAMDMGFHESLGGTYFEKAEELPSIAIILPSNQKCPNFLDPEQVGELNNKITALEQDM